MSSISALDLLPRTMDEDSAKKSKSGQSKRMISLPLEILLRIFGVWPGASCNPFCKVFWFTTMTTVSTLQYLFLITNIYSIRFSVFMYALSATLGYTMKLIKMFILWFNQRKFDDLWRTMSMNRQLSSADFNAAAVIVKTHLSHYLPEFIVAFNSVSILMFTYNTIASGMRFDAAANASRSYILMMDLPFDDGRQSVYLSVVLIQFLYALLVAAGAATINSVLIILILHLGEQIDIIRRRLMELPPSEDMRETSAIILKEVIRKHQRIIAFSENIEALYTYMALALLVLNTLIICIVGFILVTAIRMPNCSTIIAKNLMFYCAINMETFVFCFAGEYLSTKSRKIGEAAYNSPWYQSKFHSRIILLLIMRSQNQLTITMGKFVDLSLERFASILKASASYVSVLLAMY